MSPAVILSQSGLNSRSGPTFPKLSSKGTTFFIENYGLGTQNFQDQNSGDVTVISYNYTDQVSRVQWGEYMYSARQAPRYARNLYYQSCTQNLE